MKEKNGFAVLKTMKFSIIPKPQSFTVSEGGTVFTLEENLNFQVGSGCRNAAKDLSAFISKVFGFDPIGSGSETVYLDIDGVGKDESYRLNVSEHKIHIKAHDEAGAFYAVQTLKQLFLQSKGNLPVLQIDDYPTCSYRGFMLDVSRYFFTVEAVKLFLDAMALHKLNVFHWHLTDDQGWRVEIYSKLLLAQIGSQRAYTNFGKTPHGGFYSKADIEEIVRYAHERYIRVIPEIDSPGHVVSAIAAYPSLSCFNRPLDVATHSGVKHDVLCVGKESTFEFMFDVLDEICEMFPDGIVHLGGDEVPTMRWKLCPDCQKKMKDLELADEKGLHAYYINRLASHLTEKGVQPVMWYDENTENRYNSDIIFQYWGGKDVPEGLISEANGSRKVISSRSDAFYLDLPYGKINLKQTYESDTFPDGFEKTDNLSGAEACLWTEYVPSMEKAGYCTFPRLGAFSENVWTEKKNRDFKEFLSGLKAYQKLLDTLPFDYAVKKQAMPLPIRKYGYLLWFERRKLHWQGLHNLIDDRKIEREAKSADKNEKNTGI